MRYFEEIRVGEVQTFGPRQITLEDSLRFCNEFDRLPVHLDQEHAAESMYGQLIASGLHTLSLTASIVVDGFLVHTAMTGASGMENVRWHRPVTLPNELSVRVTVLAKSPPKAGKGYGILRCNLETFGQEGRLVMSATVDYLLGSKS
ncbi:MaoC/PaaZ C-terminal domain-containing protein [Halopseudomonas sp. SMJS2]|uniref:MaoC/PaaZ C-terminal domain-containing protein n=1 Tax=Halopseudomonas sp. SMJS2 TaxID=3041098 RepID=UPI002452ACE1|nr:MaoC/PaaZ C-terminal domain-containing protein [Halopseudomonas sp. SMJS2]WGK62275.1 MaoC/PaaZ C-terminal domain-containing protein [Halopseudomonas sp. SMJS2]